MAAVISRMLQQEAEFIQKGKKEFTANPLKLPLFTPKWKNVEQEKQREQQEMQVQMEEKDKNEQQEKQKEQQEKQVQMEQERGKAQVKKLIWCVPYDGLAGEVGASPSENEVNMYNGGGDYGYPLEQLDADIENMMNSDEFKDAIESLKYEMEKEYYENEY